MRDVVITSAVRTPIGSFGGGLKDISAVSLGATVIKEAVRRAGIEAEQVDEVIMGNILQAGLGQGPARQAAIQAGIPNHIPAMTINKLCGSGLKAVHLASQAVQLGDAEIVVAGGMESMSLAPYLLPQARFGYKMGDQKVVDSMIKDGLTCALNNYHMGITAENVAEKYALSREEQDAFAALSHQKASQAREAGKFKDEIVAVEIPQRKGNPLLFQEDEHIRPETTKESLAKLRAAFKQEGSVTAGNASGINDGAAALVLMSAEKAAQLGVQPLAVIRANANAAVDPAIMGIGPVYATQKALQKADLTMDNLNLIEANEAFAAQALAVGKELEWNPEIVNVNGGAVALGHPVGASGARILVTLLYEMKRRQAKLGLATLCIGGGMGVATIVERV